MMRQVESQPSHVYTRLNEAGRGIYLRPQPFEKSMILRKTIKELVLGRKPCNWRNQEVDPPFSKEPRSKSNTGLGGQGIIRASKHVSLEKGEQATDRELNRSAIKLAT